jgi:uncharacterized protein YfaS (alpha-2-macroglobulin family)
MPAANSHVRELLDDYLHDLLDRHQAAQVERHCAGCGECAAALEQARQLQAMLQAVPPSEASPQLLAQALGGIPEYERRRKRRFRTFISSSAAALAAGVLLLLGLQIHYQNLKASPYDLIVLGQRDLLAATAASLRIRLLDRDTGRPLVNVPVTVRLKSAGQEVELARFRSDAHGSGQPQLQLPDWADGSYELHVTADTPGGPEQVVQSVHLRRSWKLLLTSDKPVYQPGQTIHLRALGLRKPDLHPIAGQPTVFTLTDPKGNVLFKEKTTTSRFGIAATDCLLDREILEGMYTIGCKVSDTESRLTVEVKKYVLPKFKTEITFDKAFYQPGQEVRCTVKADYFFGKPVAGGEVRLEVHTAGVNSTALDKQSARTDEKGKAVLLYKVPQTLTDDIRLSFQVSLTDSAGQKQEQSAERLVTRQPVRIEVLPEAGQLVRDVPNKIYVFVTSADGSPVEAPLALSILSGLKTDKQGLASFEYIPRGQGMQFTIVVLGPRREELTRREINLPCGSANNDFLLRTDRAVYDAGGTVRLTALGGSSEPVFVDFLKDGQTLLTQTLDMTGRGGEMAFDLPQDLAGTLQLCAYRFDSAGRPVRKTRVLYVRAAGQVKIEAKLDAGEYRPGGTAKVDFNLTDAEGKAITGALSLAAVDEAVFSVLPQKPGMEQTFYLLEQELLRPVYTLYPWSPEADSPDLAQAAFASTARSEEQGISPTHSLSAETYSRKVPQAQAARENGLNWVHTGWVVLMCLPFGIAYAGLWCFASVQTVVQLHAVVLIPVVLVGFLWILGTHQPTVENKVNKGPGQGAPDVDKMRKSGGEGFALGADWDDGTPAAMNVGMAGAKTGDLTPKVRRSVALPIAAPGNQVEEPRVRELFPETLLWKPELITDDQGRASLNIDLADSITTWRLAAAAVTDKGRLGAAQFPLKVFQPFFADLDLPVSLTRGDSVAMPVVVYNYLDKPQTVTLSLAAGTGFRLDGDAEHRLDLGPGEVRSVRFPLKAQKVGSHELQVTARGSGVADALKRSIEVVPDGRRVEFVHNGTLQNPALHILDVPADAVEGSAAAFVKLYPSSLSQLVEGLENIFQMPSGCFEQTSSTTYPNILALDYLRRTGKSVPAVEARARQYIHLGYQRLVGFEVSGGGFDWFGHPPANRTLTAYGLMEFEDMARVHDVDPALIERTRRWLLAQRDRDGSWASEGHGLHDDATRAGDGSQHRLATTAYIAWAVFAHGAASSEASATLAYLLRHRPEDIRDPHVLALVCNALLILKPDGQQANPYLDRLDSLKKTSPDGTLAWWEQPEGARTTFYAAGRSARVETTALAALAFLEAKRPTAARQPLAWLISQKDARGTWYSTQATVLSLKALLAGTSAPQGDGERRIEVRLGDRLIQEFIIPADQAEVLKQVDLTPHLAAGGNSLRIVEKSGTACGYQVTFRYHLPEEAKPSPDGPLALALKYDRTELAVGEGVRATVRVENRMKQSAAMVMLDLPLPAGFAPVAEDFQGMVRVGTIARYQVRPLQVLVYLRDLAPSKPLELSYHLRATMPVQVTAPGARAYEYYAPEREGRSTGARFVVKAKD